MNIRTSEHKNAVIRVGFGYDIHKLVKGRPLFLGGIKIPYSKGSTGDEILMDKVLFLNDGTNMIVGNPFVKDVSFTANIVNHGRERKIIVFKFKRRKGYQKKQGHRQPYTEVEIKEIIS